MSDDALERLKRRNRPTVKSRDTSIVSSQDTQTSRNLDNEIAINIDNQISGKQKDEQGKTLIESKIESNIPEDKNDSKSDIQTSTHSDISTSRHQDIMLKTKQTTLRLEEGISKELSDLCKEAGFGREVFIEALFEYYQQHQDDLPEVMAEARKKAELRMEVANQKRAKSMMKKFNPSP